MPDKKECKDILNPQKRLSLQSFLILKILKEISPLRKELMNLQPTINIATIGGNLKGKAILVQSLWINSFKAKSRKGARKNLWKRKKFIQNAKDLSMQNYINAKDVPRQNVINHIVVKMMIY